jgi:dephospho-CoA kinase
MKKKLLVIGHGRHGKDTVCELLRDKYGYSFESSSRFCSKLFIFDMLKDKYGYDNEEQCYADRHNHRAEWYNAICDYNIPDAARLGREIFREHDIYCGLRNKREFFAMKNTGVFDYVIWVDRSDHLPPESKDSMSLEQWMADFTIDNNSSLEDLEFNLDQLMSHLISKSQE